MCCGCVAAQVITAIMPHLHVIAGGGGAAGAAAAGSASSASRALDLIAECEAQLLKCDAAHTKVPCRTSRVAAGESPHIVAHALVVGA